MKILKVIHGYPMRYNAGSEVYSQTLVQGLSDKHEVQVFTREEDVLKPDYSYSQELDADDARILLHIVNSPRIRLGECYRHPEIDRRFAEVLDNFNPDVVHIGHLNHLSTSLVFEAKSRDIPIVFTLHDYWLMCPRGQFIQRNSKEPAMICSGQSDEKCAKKCYRLRGSGNPDREEEDTVAQTDWISERMGHMRDIIGVVDKFIAPSKYLLSRFVEDFSLPQDKVTYLDYGFDLTRLSDRSRVQGTPLTFGYIGTHIQSKGVQDLIVAFARVKGDSILRIWGREREETASLKKSIKGLPQCVQDRIFWMGEYENSQIVNDVFNHVDAVVVPSIWVENSPLVIHEALQVGIPVVTADVGGMKEYVEHGVNGLLFEHRSVESLATQLQTVVDDPSMLNHLAQKRYLRSKSGDVVSVEEHVAEVEKIYIEELRKKNREVPSRPGPWRITFDTNPDHCNYSCVMCEGFSPHSKVKQERVKAKIKPRLMDIALIRKILKESVGTPLKEIVPSMMGEPLLYKEFGEIIDLCHEYNLKLNLTTNGSFPIRGVDEWAKLIVPVGSDVKISWNGACKETHEKIMSGSNWEKVTQNLARFIQIRDEHAKQGGNFCRVTLQLTFLESNVDELAEIVALAIEYGVNRVKGHHLWAHFEEIKDLSMRRSKESIVRWNRAVDRAYKVAEETPLSNGKKILLENIFPLDPGAEQDLAPGGPCPFLGQEAWVNTVGRFSPCCAPDKQRQTLGDFGNLTKNSLEEIWLNKDYSALRKNYLKHPLCLGCNMRKRLHVEAD